MVLRRDGEAVPFEGFGENGHVEEGDVELLGADAWEQAADSGNGEAVEEEHLVERQQAGRGPCEGRTLLEDAWQVRVKHGAVVQRVQRRKGLCLAVVHPGLTGCGRGKRFTGEDVGWDEGVDGRCHGGVDVHVEVPPVELEVVEVHHGYCLVGGLVKATVEALLDALVDASMAASIETLLKAAIDTIGGCVRGDR